MWFTPDKKNELPVFRQLYEKIKFLIHSGVLKGNEKLPSSRFLSKDLGVARSTVLEAYDQLIAEGYLETRQGSGTRVVQGLVALPPPAFERSSVKSAFRGCRVGDVQSESIINFRSGIPDLEAFPQKEWARIYARVCGRLPSSSFRYSGPEGVWALREAISAYLFRMRGLKVSPGRVMITSGSTQGLAMISRLLRKTGEYIFAEDPAHTGMIEVVSRAGLGVQGVPVDEKGMDVSALQLSYSQQSNSNLAFVYTTPSHQYPLGAILPVQRRQSLVHFARENQCVVIEDDYDSEFRHEGAPTSALYELDPEVVIYLGSFSKILAPALRLGFAIIPEHMICDWKAEKMYTDVHTEALSQHTLAEFLNSGGLERHIWKMKKLYARKRNHALACLKNVFGGAVSASGQTNGLHIVVTFPDLVFTDDLVNELYEHGVKVIPVDKYSLNRNSKYAHKIVLGYSHLTHEEISRGLEIIKKVAGYAC
ncbi:MAG: PLP-dependent aminotransferase family protein [Desulfovibrio sp.]|uniref:MocR-like pyridoxine biosynthesis transcription factor PdxR n=1 Tax=Desulfovibrio sp. TaxID=885 RepID=UPI0039E59D56